MGAAYQDYCDWVLVGWLYNPDLSPYTLQGTATAFNRPLFDDLEDNADYQASVVTPPVVPLELLSWGVSIASWTFAANLWPDGTIWNNPWNLKSVSIRARRSNTTNSIPWVGNQVLVVTTDNKYVLLTNESATYSVEDGNIQNFANVECLGNAAALITYNRL